MEDIQALCKRVIIINQGRKVYDRQLAEIARDFSALKELTITSSEPVARDDMERIAPIREFDPEKVTFRVKREELTRVIGQLLGEFKVDDLNTAEVEIADFYRYLAVDYRRQFPGLLRAGEAESGAIALVFGGQCHSYHVKRARLAIWTQKVSKRK